MSQHRHPVLPRATPPAALLLLISAVSCGPKPARLVWPRTPPPAARAYQRAPDEIVVPARMDERPRVVVHKPFDEVRCGECHVNAKGGGGLLESADKLCMKCHKDSIARPKMHAAAARSCLECHARHVSMAKGLLAGDEGKICARCHEVKSRKLVRAHMGYPVERARCTRCHDPHGTSGEVALRANVHRPATRCTNCHVAATEPEPLALIRSERETCGRCHPDADPTEFAEFEHAPFGAGCTACHEPHAADRPHLLAAPEKDLCLGCHEEVADTLARGSAHAPAAQGKCHLCHSPHGADRRGLLLASAPALCVGCHARWHQASAAVRAPAEDSQAQCLYCHDPHGSGRPGLLRHERRIAGAMGG